jgi:hypothetical protein
MMANMIKKLFRYLGRDKEMLDRMKKYEEYLNYLSNEMNNHVKYTINIAETIDMHPERIDEIRKINDRKKKIDSL